MPEAGNGGEAMDLQSNLIESKKRREKGGWQASVTSLILHGLLVGSIILIGATTSHRVDAEDKPIRAFVTQGAAPPPPPPPPPPAPAASSSAPKATPHIEPIQPKPIPHDAFIPPREIPKDIPKVEIPSTAKTDDVKPAEDLPASAPTQAVGGVANGVPGGVAGGVQGGVVGGEVGGVAGGQVGGVKGGEVGGVLGGKVGGTGTGTEGDGSGGKEAPAEPPSGPLRVGGDVKAPTVVTRIEPKYTETARAGRVAGVVIVEAIIDKNGNVDQVKVVKGLPMGLSEEAERAVRQWKFRPGTMNGQPVDVIFNLTVNFKLGA
jgi:periplasmic protein TonB